MRSPWIREFDDFFNQFMAPMVAARRGIENFNVLCDVDETESHYLMSFDLPGVSKDDVKIEVVDNQLVVSGERKSEMNDDKNNRHVTERYYGSFRRSFSLPSKIDADRIEADFKDGVLHIAVPKSEALKPKQIKITEGKGGLFSKLMGGQKKQTEQVERRASGH
jgi:HSP20 family protein